ncbi:VWA domain-containing protein [Granulicella sp. WH15]|uniref:VWA domain-containing protein n=1 Tax=Granulicella sp. WH15 TaxID=2602070 RepID=UPI0013675785|nr:VWA domain-containing protein [Granulicella sp. WH15]QHN02553.1 VWA domain-containing protein [Granulicella sp. WH15]
MSTKMRVCLFLAALLPALCTASAQQTPETGKSRSIHLNVVVRSGSGTKAGPPVADLQQQDFTLIDNKLPRPITAFKAVRGSDAPTRVILLIDALNTRFTTVAYERDEAQKFLRSNGGHLTHPTAVAVLTDKGVQMQPAFSRDGNALADALGHYEIGLRELTRSTGIYGANDRLQISTLAVRQLTNYAATLPGRKALLWISPGWALLSGPRIELNAKQQQGVFGDVVAYSTEMREANLTLYNINPIGASEGLLRSNYYQTFLKGISKPSQVDLGDLGLQVLAIQSGGLTFESSSDTAGLLKQSLEDLDAWYEIDFDAVVSEKPNEYHHIEIKLDKPGLIARTRDGYYAQPR